MKSLLVVDAAEYNAATDRISSALQTLRDEMKTLRHQDVTLMRQFITMNDTIRTISKEHKTDKTRKKRLRNKTLMISSIRQQTTPSWQIPLVRQQSVPRFCDVIPEVRERTWSCSSDESSQYSRDDSIDSSVSSLDDDNISSDDSITTAVPVFRPPVLTRQRSHSLKTPDQKVSTVGGNDNESNIEDILKNNIKLWKTKLTVSEDNDNVFDEPATNDTADS